MAGSLARLALPLAMAVGILLVGAAATVHEECQEVVREAFILDKTITPSHYQLSIIPDVSGFETFTGSVNIDVTTTATDRTVVLHAGASLSDLDVDVVALTEDGVGDTLAIKCTKHVKEDEAFYIRLDGPLLLAGSRYRIVLKYKGVIGDDRKGFYRAAYRQDKKTVALTEFAPIYARHAFPCFDEPSFRATFQLTLGHSKDLHVLATMPVSSTSRTLLEGDLLLTTFETTPPMAPHSLGWVVSRLSSLGAVHADVHTFGREGTGPLLPAAQARTRALLQRLQDYTGRSFGLDKLDQVAAPARSAARSASWGVITLREENLLCPTQAKSVVQLDGHMQAAHEVVHQWFGGLVTASWWSHAWLSEGLTQLLKYTVMRQEKPMWELGERMAVLEAQLAFRADEQADALPLTSDVTENSQLLRKLSTLTYSKGASVLRMLEDVLTPATFQKGLGYYLDSAANKAAAPADFWTALDKAAAEDGQTAVTAADFGKSWTEQAGYPVLTAVRQYAERTVEVTQAPFRAADDEAVEDARAWTVPVRLVGKGNVKLAEAVYAAAGPALSAAGPKNNKDWVLLNPSQKGYYRANYDVPNWIRLARALRSDPIDTLPSEGSRAMLVDDALSLASYGLLDYPVALHLVQSLLPRERSLAPWTAAARHIDYLAKFFRGPHSATASVFNAWVRSLVDGAYKDVGFFGGTGGSDEDRNALLPDAALRAHLTRLACEAGHPQCAKLARAQHARWRAQSGKVQADTLALALCHGVTGPWARDDALSLALDRLATTDGATREDILRSLSCLGGDQRTQLLTQLFTDDRLDADDALLVWKAVTSTYTGTRLALAAAAAQHDAVVKKFGEAYFASLLSVLAASVTTESQLTTLRTLSALLTAELSEEAKGLEKAAELNVAWRRQYLDTVNDTLAAVDGASVVSGLPDTVVPTNYALELFTPDIHAGPIDPKAEVRGNEVTISVVPVQDADVLALHVGRHLRVTVISVSDHTKYKTIGEIRYDADNPWPDANYDATSEILRLPLATEMLADEKYFVSVKTVSEYNVLVGDVQGGLFVKTLPDGVKTVLGTRSQPLLTHHLFPCFNEPQFLATFDVTVNVLTEFTPLGSSQITAHYPDSSVSDHSRSIVEFATTPKLPADLVAVTAFSPLEAFSAGPITLHVRQEVAALSQLPASIAQQANQLINLVDGVLYGGRAAVPGVQVVAVPQLQGGSVNARGLVLAREGDVLVDAISQSEQTLLAARTLADSVARTFVGDDVSLENRDDLWLKEGIVDYLQSWALDQVFSYSLGDGVRYDLLGIFRSFVLDAAETAPALDSGLATVEHAASKGAGLVRMLANLVGEPALFAGLQKVLKSTPETSRKVSATELALTLQQAADEASEALPVSVVDLVESWTSRAGHPILSVYRDYKTGTAGLRQDRFTWSAPASSRAWVVPYTVILAGAEQPARVLSTTEDSIEVGGTADDYLLINANHAGFYRVNYDDQNWQLLVKAAAGNALSDLQKANLIDDALALCRAGRLDVEVLLDLLVAATSPVPLPTTPAPATSPDGPTATSDSPTAATTAATAGPSTSAAPQSTAADTTAADTTAAGTTTAALSDGVPVAGTSLCVPCWAAARYALSSLGHLARQLPDHRSTFKRFVAEKLVDAAYTEVGWAEADEEPWYIGVARAVVTEIACGADHAACVDEASAASKLWVDNPSSSTTLGVDADVLAPTICFLMRRAPQNSDFAEVNVRLFSTEDKSARRAYIAGAGCVADTDFRDVLLIVTADKSSVDSADTLVMFEAIMDNSDADLSQVIDFIADNFKDVTSSLGESVALDVLDAAAARVYDQEQYEKLAALEAKQRQPSARVSAAVRRAAASLSWSKLTRPKLLKWVYAQFGLVPPEPTTVAPPTTTSTSTTARPTTRTPMTASTGPTKPTVTPRPTTKTPPTHSTAPTRPTRTSTAAPSTKAPNHAAPAAPASFVLLLAAAALAALL